jgi:hypothetical protein
MDLNERITETKARAEAVGYDAAIVLKNQIAIMEALVAIKQNLVELSIA